MNSVSVKFKASQVPQMLARLSHSNQFLKVFTAGSLAISIGLMTLLFLTFLKGPKVVVLTSKATLLELGEMPKAEDEIRQALRAYIERRYNWTEKTVDKNLEMARAFVAERSVQNFAQGVSNVRKFSKEKAVSQRAYAQSIAVDLKRSTAMINGDRITEIQGMRAAGAFNLELAFQGGPRTDENPWGIYVTKETEK